MKYSTIIILVSSALLSQPMSQAIADESTENTENTQKLITALAVRDLTIRQAVITALGNTGDPAAVKPLMAICDQGDYRARRLAYTVLSKVASAEAFDLLLAALRDDDSEIVRSAVAGLVKIDDPRAIPGLVDVLGTSNQLTIDAQKALLSFGDKAVGPLSNSMINNPFKRRYTTKLLTRIGTESAGKALSSYFKTSCWQKKRTMLYDCRDEMRKQYPDMLADLVLDSYSPEVNEPYKRTIVSSLVRLTHEDKRGNGYLKVDRKIKVHEFLCKIISDDPDCEVRYEALSIIPRSDIRNRSASAELFMRTEYAQKALLSALKEKDKRFRSKISRVPLIVTHKSLMPAYIELLKSEDESIRLRVASQLVSNDALHVIAKTDKLTKQALISAAQDSNPSVRLNAAKTLVKLDDSDVSDVLVKLISDENEDVVKVALDYLKKSDNPKTIDAIIAELGEFREKIAHEMIQILAANGSHKAISAMKKQLAACKDPSVIQLLIFYLGKTGEKSAVNDIAKFINHKHKSPRQAAILALAKIGTKEAADILVKALSTKHSEYEIKNILSSLKKLARAEHCEALCEFLTTGSKKIYKGRVKTASRTQTIWLLAQLGGIKCAQALTEEYEDPSSSSPMRKIAARALLQASRKSRLPVKYLYKLGQNKDRNTRQAALQYIANNVRKDDKQSLEVLLSAYTKGKLPTHGRLLLPGIARIDPVKATKLFIENFKKSKSPQEQAFSQAIEKTGEVDVVQAMIELLAHSDQKTQIEAIKYLGRIGDPRALKPLESLVEKNTGSVLLHSRESIVLIKERQ